jgi:DNA-binding beta-propeller fold protein YncE
LKTTLDGEVVWKIGKPDHEAYKGAKPRGFVPTNIAVTKAGDVFVADGYGANWIHKYTAKGEYVKSFGGPGKEAGQLSCPHGIWIDTRSGTEEVLVADRANVRLQYFDLDGKHLRIVTKDGDKLRHPCHFDVYDGVLLVPDLHSRVTLLDKENNLITHLGDCEIKNYGGINGRPPAQWKQGQFIAPHGACFDKTGNIFVAEWVKPGRVTKLEKVKA